jgi:O-antigen/teichoic acid export membrane protein
MVASPTSRLAVALALTSMPLSLFLGNQLNLLRGCERFGAYSAVRLGQSVAWTLLVGVFSALGLASTKGLLVGFILITACATGWASIILFQLMGRPRFDIRGASRLLRYGVLVWVAGIAFQVNFRIDQVLLGTTVSSAALGQYAAAVSLASMLTVVSTGIAIVTLPAVARAEPDASVDVGRRHLAIAFVTMSLLAITLAAAAPTMIVKLLGASFLPAVPIFRILLLGQIALGSTQILHEIFRGQRRLRLPAVVETTGAVFTVALLVLAIPRWGTIGAAWVSVGVYWPVASVLYLALVRGNRFSQRPQVRPDNAEMGEDHVAFPDT